VLDGKRWRFWCLPPYCASNTTSTFKERLSAFRVRGRVPQPLQEPQGTAGSCRSMPWCGGYIAIGTHRLIQKDVTFKDLGLLVIDEEQRFGVSHRSTSSACARRWMSHPHPLPPSAPAQSVTGKCARHERNGDAAGGQVAHQDFRGRVQRPLVSGGHCQRAGAQRTGILRAQPRAEHSHSGGKNSKSSSPKPV